MYETTPTYMPTSVLAELKVGPKEKLALASEYQEAVYPLDELARCDMHSSGQAAYTVPMPEQDLPVVNRGIMKGANIRQYEIVNTLTTRI